MITRHLHIAWGRANTVNWGFSKHGPDTLGLGPWGPVRWSISWHCFHDNGGVGDGGLLAKSCLTLCDPKDHTPPDSSICGISQARILKWVAMPSSRGSSWPMDRTHTCSIASNLLRCRQILYHWATRETPFMIILRYILPFSLFFMFAKAT